MHKRLVIIGGGFCGTVLAANLLRRLPAEPTEIVLIERGPEMGRGIAYAVHDCPYLLNVPAGRLSADSKDPLQFLHYAKQIYADADAEDFLPRQLYGDYLQDFLGHAERAAPPQVTLTRVFDEVISLSPRTGAEFAAADFANRESIGAQRVILALGNPPPTQLPCAESVQQHPAYHADPRAPLDLGAEHSVLIVGNGLTMADVAFSLSRHAARAPRMTAISRRGLVSLPQSTFRASAVQGDGTELLAHANSMRRVLSASRALAREVVALGGDWREVVTFIRNIAPGLWQQLPDRERQRFVRHLQPYWDVHRHRLPPQVASSVEWLRRSGHLDIQAGRIHAMEPDGDRLRVTWRRRGSGESETLVVDAVINATGPDFAVNRSGDKLVQALRRDGWIAEDPLGLGLRTTQQGACIRGDGTADRHLYYVGPMLRAGHWEATAATELRNHAERLAQHLASDQETGIP